MKGVRILRVNTIYLEEILFRCYNVKLHDAKYNNCYMSELKTLTHTQRERERERERSVGSDSCQICLSESIGSLRYIKVVISSKKKKQKKKKETTMQTMINCLCICFNNDWIFLYMGWRLRKGTLEHTRTAKNQTRLRIRIFAVRLHNIGALLEM